MGASGWSVTTHGSQHYLVEVVVGASGWSVTTLWQSTLPGGGRGGCQWVVSDHPWQSTLLVEVVVGASGWSVTTHWQSTLLVE